MRCKYLLIPKEWKAPDCQTATLENSMYRSLINPSLCE